MTFRVIVVLFGLFVIVATLVSAIRTVILSRGVQSVITRTVFMLVRVPFNVVAHERRSYEARDKVMALYAPVGLVVLPMAWLGLEILGFTLVFEGLTDSSLADAYHLSGS